jgi:hypothetical protein
MTVERTQEQVAADEWDRIVIRPLERAREHCRWRARTRQDDVAAAVGHLVDALVRLAVLHKGAILNREVRS